MVVFDLLSEMFLDGLLVDLLELLLVLAIQEYGVAIVELGLRHRGLGELVQNVLPVDL